MTQLQRCRHIRFVHETKVQKYPVEPLPIGFDLEALLRWHPWHVLTDYRQQHHLIVQHLVMQHVVQQSMGDGVWSRSQKNRRAFDPVRWLHTDAGNKQWQRQATFIEALYQDLLAALPGGHQHKQGNPRQYRKGAALHHFRDVCSKEQTIDKQKAQQHGHRQYRWPLPQQQHHRGHQQRGHQHCPGHGYPIGRGQCPGRLEAQHQQDHANHQRPVHRPNIDLALLVA
ncbi:hypothetical protein D3C79_742940 [compost metagenome]